MPLWIFFRDGVPDGLLTENSFPVLHRGDFPVTAAQVESDPASIQVPSERRRGFFGGRHTGGMHDFEAPFVNPSPHDLGVKFPGGRLFVMLCQAAVQFFWSVEMNPVPAPGPEQKLGEPLQVMEIAGRSWMFRWKNRDVPAEDRPVRL